MSVEELITKLENIVDDIEYYDVINGLDVFLDRLEFILFDCNEIVNNLSIEEKQDNIMDITTLKVMFFSELIKKYLEKTTKDKYTYEINDMFFLGQTSGYNAKTDMAIFSPLGMSLNSISDADIMKTIFHEFRHQRQTHFANIKDFKEMLNYPSNFIRILKNKIPKDVYEKIDEQGNIVDNSYYNINYSRMYIEVDADITGLFLLRKMFYDLYDLCPYKDTQLKDKVKKIQEFLILNSFEVEETLNEQNRLQNIYVDEITKMNDITSEVVKNGKKDSLLFIDKCVKENISYAYPVFDIFKNNDGFKNYIEIMHDKNSYIKEYNDKDKINEIYNYYIKSDPVLIVSDYIFNNNIEKIKEFIELHPTFKKHYQKEIIDMINLLYADETIIDLLVIKKNKKLIKKDI